MKDTETKNSTTPDPFRRFGEFVKKMAAVPKEELDEKQAEYKRKRERKKQAG